MLGESARFPAMNSAALLVLIACTAATIAQGQLLQDWAAKKATFLSFLASQGSAVQPSNGLSLEGTSLKTYTPPSGADGPGSQLKQKKSPLDGSSIVKDQKMHSLRTLSLLYIRWVWASFM